MTTLPRTNRSHLTGNVVDPTCKRSLQVRWFIAPVISLAIIVGCVADSMPPVIEHKFNDPVKIVLPTTQISSARDATIKAESSATTTVDRVSDIQTSNIDTSKPVAIESARSTLAAVRAIREPLDLAAAINAVASERVQEARMQTEDARSMLLESEKMRAAERVAAKKIIEEKERQLQESKQWLPRAVSGISILIGVGLIGLGVYSFIAPKTKLNGTALAMTGIAALGVGSALWWYGWAIGLIGLALILVATGFLIYLQIARQRSQTLQVVKGVEVLKANGKITMDEATADTMNVTQSDPATKALVDVVTKRKTDK